MNDYKNCVESGGTRQSGSTGVKDQAEIDYVVESHKDYQDYDLTLQVPKIRNVPILIVGLVNHHWTISASYVISFRLLRYNNHVSELPKVISNIRPMSFDTLGLHQFDGINIIPLPFSNEDAKGFDATTTGTELTPSLVDAAIDMAQHYNSNVDPVHLGSKIICTKKLAEQNQIIRNRESPIMNLASELLETIFLHCLPKTTCHPVPSIAPLLLCQVCSKWRSIAIAFPALWSTLHIAFAHRLSSTVPGESTKRSFENMMHMWFARAKNYPLSLYLKYGHQNGKYQGDDLIESPIMSYSHRFRKFDFQSETANSLHRLLSLPSGRVEMLEHLHIGYAHEDLDHLPLTVFQDAPELRKVVITSMYWGFTWLDDIGSQSDRMFLPWAQLTHLKIMPHFPLSTWRLLFKQCTLLQRGHFWIDSLNNASAATTSDPDEKPVTFPDLVELDLNFLQYTPNHSHLSFFWPQGFLFPALTELTLHHHGINHAMVQALQKNPWIPLQALRRLSLRSVEIAPEDLITLLSLTNSVTELNLVLSRPGYEGFWSPLACSNTSDTTSILPQLERLGLAFVSANGAYYPKEVARMIKSRWWNKDVLSPPPVSCLRSVSLSVCDTDAAEQMMHLLEACVLEGLKVEITCESSQNDAPWYTKDPW